MNITATASLPYSISAARQDPKADSAKGSPESVQAAKNKAANASGTAAPDYDEYIPSGEKPEEPDSDKQVPSGKKPEKPEEEKCTANTDKVDAEIERLRKARETLQRQIQQAADDPDKCAQLEQKLAQVERELTLKDNDSYRKQHAVYTNS